MKKLALALASTAIAAAASSTFVSTAEAGGRGGHRFHFGFHHFRHFHAPQTAYRHDDDEYYYRRRKPKVIIKEVVRHVPVPAKPVAVSKPKAVASAKLTDQDGREFDRVSKVWFDGKDQCWKGDRAFAFRGDSWFYGNARWVETSNGWGVSSGALPQQVSCAGVQAFSGRIQQAEATSPVAPKAEPKAVTAAAAVEPAPAQVATAPQPAPVATPVAAPAPNAPATPANARECKKYFPSVGEMVSVPCTE